LNSGMPEGSRYPLRAMRHPRMNAIAFKARKSAHLRMTPRNQRNTPPVFFATSATILAATASIS
jgi:hypothetical protein